MSIPLSMLDRANTRVVDGQPVDAAQIFAEVTARAQNADALGYHRFWIAEHHSVPGIAGSTPTVLLPHLASATTRIRLGTGGIMVPSHQPLVIAEQLGTLQALYGERFDAGLGGSTGFTKPVRTALRQAADAKDRIGDDIDEVVSYLNGTADITAYPPDHSRTPLHVLTGGGSAAFAASRGMGLVLGGPAVTRGLNVTEERHTLVEHYRRDFVMSPHRKQPPRVIASVNVAVAKTREAAGALVISEAWALTLARSIGVFQALESPAMVRQQHPSEQQARRIQRSLASTIYGTPDDVVKQLAAVVAYTQADEILVTGNMWDPAAQLTSDRLLFEAWNAR